MTPEPQGDLSNVRLEYHSTRSVVTHEENISWSERFQHWYDYAQSQGQLEPNAMVLATSGADGTVRTRTVLAKEYSPAGIVFYTNYASVKAGHIAENPQVSATFLWLSVHRQVHISGRAERVSDEISTQYWNKRPRDSQLGAWASHQSSPIATRADLDRQYAQVKDRFSGVDSIPKPPQWGGFRIKPERVEFWEGDSGRMHDRLEYSLVENKWQVQLLQP